LTGHGGFGYDPDGLTTFELSCVGVWVSTAFNQRTFAPVLVESLKARWSGRLSPLVEHRSGKTWVLSRHDHTEQLSRHDQAVKILLIWWAIVLCGFTIGLIASFIYRLNDF